MRRPGVGAGRRQGYRGIGSGGGGAAPAYDYMTGLGTLSMVHDFAVGVDSTTTPGFITSITDRTANGNTLTALGAGVTLPAYVAASANFNSQPTGLGDGVDDSLRRAATTLGGTFAPGTMILVAKLAANVNGRNAQTLGNAGMRGTESTLARIGSVLGATTINGATSFLTAAHVLMAITDGATLSRYVDGVADGAPAAAATTVASGGAFGLFSAASAAGYSNVEIAFSAVSLTALSAGQMAAFVAYAQGRWGTP